jgi:hypothetical protein
VSGVLLGVLVSISPVGAGAIGVTFLVLLYARLPLARIVGSDIAHAVPSVGIGRGADGADAIPRTEGVWEQSAQTIEQV